MDQPNMAWHVMEYGSAVRRGEVLVPDTVQMDQRSVTWVKKAKYKEPLESVIHTNRKCVRRDVWLWNQEWAVASGCMRRVGVSPTVMPMTWGSSPR